MAKERFESRRLSGTVRVVCKYENSPSRVWEVDKQEILGKIVSIVTAYRGKGLKLTLRQLHYQLVTRNWIVNHTTAYQKLSGLLDDLRYSGIIDWDDIEDRGRIPYLPYFADNLVKGLEDLKKQYRIDRQEGQTTYVELWTEKDALSGILSQATEKYHIQLVVNKGYTSSSALYNAYQRIQEKIIKGIKVRILYFGDHDPSGLDMVRDIHTRLTTFLCSGDSLRRDKQMLKWWEDSNQSIFTISDAGLFSMKAMRELNKNADLSDATIQEFDYAQVKLWLDEFELFKVLPIGLNMEQIEQYDLPANPAKMTDSRADKYVAKYGRTCWEVDALEPEVLLSIVETHITQQLDLELYARTCEKEQVDITQLSKIIKTESKRKK